MAADSSALNVILTANFKRLEQDLKQAGVLAQNAVSDMEDKFAKARFKTDAFRGSFAGNLAAGAVKSIAEQIANIPTLVYEANKALADIGTSSERTGLSKGRIQELQYAGSQEGIGAQDTLKALDSVAKKIDEIAHGGENGLSKLFADNKEKVTDLNSTLNITANLMKGASNAFEKERIAEAVGLTKDWVPVLENGAEAMNKVSQEAHGAGAVIQDDIIDKAKKFQRDWDQAVTNFANNAKASLGPLLQMLIDLVGLATKVAGAAGQRMLNQHVESITRGGPPADPAQGPSVETYDYYFKKIRDGGEEVADVWLKARDARAKFEEEMKKSSGLPTTTVTPGKGTTDVSSLYKTGSGAAEETDAVDRYIERLQRSVEVLAAEQAALGKSRAERALSVEMAKAEAAARQRGNDLTADEIAKVIELAQRKGELNQALALYAQKQHQVADLAQFTGQQIQSAFETLLDGGKIEDSINRITRALASAAIQAALLGQGPLAGLLGTAAAPGGNGVGGLIGTLISSFGGARASGGPVQAGKIYRINENGQEYATFGQNGTVHPASVMGARGGGGGGLIVNVRPQAGETASVQETRGPGGVRQLEIMVEAAVVKNIAKNGGIAQALQNTYGSNRVAGRR